MMQIIVAELVGIITQTYSGCLPGPSGSVTFSHLRHVLVRPETETGNRHEVDNDTAERRAR